MRGRGEGGGDKTRGEEGKENLQTLKLCTCMDFRGYKSPTGPVEGGAA